MSVLSLFAAEGFEEELFTARTQTHCGSGWGGPRGGGGASGFVTEAGSPQSRIHHPPDANYNDNLTHASRCTPAKHAALLKQQG